MVPESLLLDAERLEAGLRAFRERAAERVDRCCAALRGREPEPCPRGSPALLAALRERSGRALVRGDALAGGWSAACAAPSALLLEGAARPQGAS